MCLQEEDMMGWFNAVIERRTLLGWAIVAIVAAIATVIMLALARPSVASHGPTDRYKDAEAEFDQLREATGKYHNVQKALQDGYVAPTRRGKNPSSLDRSSLNCVFERTNVPSLGGMGYHFVHRQDILEGSPFEVGVGGDPLKPEAMLYETKKDGEFSLVAVEWIVRDEDQTITPNEPQPQLILGTISESFHGPMDGHEYWAGSPYIGPLGPVLQSEWQPIHYDLHAWIWEENSRGVFDDWNPDVSCP
jgi:hypothetical protein